MQTKKSIKERIGSSIIALIVLEVFCIISCIYSVYLKDPQFIVLSIVTMALICIPWLFEKMFHLRFTKSMEIFSIILIVCCTIMGHVWQMYYIVPTWDKIVHTLFGFFFAAFGYILPQMADRKSGRKTSKALCIICAIMAVMAASAIWEYSEFICDYTFHMDLQRDTIVNRLTSYDLGSSLGEQGVINNIHSVVVNGQELGLNGYLDIGLYDTMIDMITATIGGLIFALLAGIKKGKAVAFMIPDVLPWDKQEYLKYIAEHEMKKSEKVTE